MLAPFIFIIVLDFVLRQTRSEEFGFITKPRRSSRYPREVLQDLGYADDLTLLDSSTAQAIKHLEKLEAESASSGLTFNADKLKVMLSKSYSDAPLVYKGEVLERIEKAEYLGAMLPFSRDEFRARLGKARGAFCQLFGVWKCPAPFELKYRIFMAAVGSILLSEIETLTLNETMLKQCDSFQRRCFRSMLGITWEDRVTTEELMGRVKGLLGSRCIPLSKIAVRRQLRWVGHAIRSTEGEPLQKYVLFSPQHGKRSRGGQRTLFHQALMRFLPKDMAGSTIDDIRHMALDRSLWRHVVENCRTY